MDDDIQTRLKETSQICLDAYVAWEGKKKDTKAQEELHSAIHELRKVSSRLEIELAISEKRLFFRTSKEQFSLPMSYYQYPNYMNFLSRLNDDDVSRLEVDRKLMIESLERISIFNTDSNRCTYFMLNTGETVLYSQGQEMGTATESLESVFSGELDKIAFPTKNLIDILNHFNSDKVKFALTGQEAPCGITGEDDPDYQVILMPMMIQEETYYTEDEA